MSTSTTPKAESSAKRSASGSRRPASRPTTPLRPSSRTSLRESRKGNVGGVTETPLEAFEPMFGELSDSMADLEANVMHLQLMHESLSRFSENFASFLYGLNMNAFCVDFPEAPISDSFRQGRDYYENIGKLSHSEKLHGELDGETTFMTTDTSFVDNPPTSSKTTPKSASIPALRTANASGREGSNAPIARGNVTRGNARNARGSGLARAKGRNTKS